MTILIAITGGSGSGKSTLLHMLGGITRPSAGRVLLEGVDLASLDDDALAEIRRRRIGFVFQRYNLLPELSLAENVALPLVLDGVPETRCRQAARHALEAVGIDPASRRFLMLKSRVHWRAGLRKYARAIVECAGTGVCTSDYGSLVYRKLRRPIYPLDPAATP
jgi:ABC-type proline/glycine betaine transport system ATPase subunit